MNFQKLQIKMITRAAMRRVAYCIARNERCDIDRLMAIQERGGTFDSDLDVHWYNSQ